MMIKFFLSILLLTTSLDYSTFAQASDAEGRYWIYGIGRQTCQTFSDARKNGGYAEISYENWVSGYLTSANKTAEDNYNVLGDLDRHGAMAWLDKYCVKNPNNTIYMAMDNMVAVMYPTRRRSK